MNLLRRRRLARSASRTRPSIVLEPASARAVRARTAATAAVIGDDAAVRARLEAAPPGYLLTQDAVDVARQCRLAEPRPSADEVRVTVTPAPGSWRVDVAARDRPGLLAAVTGVLAAHELGIVQAVVATWDDGTALDAFVVTATEAPDLRSLTRELSASLGAPPSAGPVADAVLTFDDDASPWYTRCDVRARDRLGLFHALAVAFAASGADVHAARAITADGDVLDRFDLTDGAGAKLNRAVEHAIRERVRRGVPEDAVIR